MAMSRKDYVKFAQVFADEMASTADSDMGLIARTALRSVHQKVMDIFEADNPNFDRTRFLDASGML